MKLLRAVIGWWTCLALIIAVGCWLAFFSPRDEPLTSGAWDLPIGIGVLLLGTASVIAVGLAIHRTSEYLEDARCLSDSQYFSWVIQQLDSPHFPDRLWALKTVAAVCGHPFGAIRCQTDDWIQIAALIVLHKEWLPAAPTCPPPIIRLVAIIVQRMGSTDTNPTRKQGLTTTRKQGLTPTDLPFIIPSFHHPLACASGWYC